MALYASRPAFMYGAGAAAAPWSNVALLGVACWIAHFAKRELETFFVHRFSRPTMPMCECLRNTRTTIVIVLFAAVSQPPLTTRLGGRFPSPTSSRS